MSDTYSDRNGNTFPTPQIPQNLKHYCETVMGLERFKGAETIEQLHNLKGQFFVIDHLNWLAEEQNKPKE